MKKSLFPEPKIKALLNEKLRLQKRNTALNTVLLCTNLCLDNEKIGWSFFRFFIVTAYCSITSH